MMMKNLFKLLILASACVSMMGCATTLRAVNQPFEGEISPSLSQEGIQVSIAVKRSIIGWPELLGMVATPYLAINLTNLVFSYTTPAAATQMAMAIAGGSILVDIVGSNLVPARMPEKVTFTFRTFDQAEEVAQEISVRSLGHNRYMAVVPADKLGDIKGDGLIQIKDTQGRELYSSVVTENEVLSALNPAAPVPVIEPSPVAETAGAQMPDGDNQEAILVDVDYPPRTRIENPEAIAVVIGIEKYRGRTPPVQFATRDAQTFKAYLNQSLGVPEENVVTLLNEAATAASIRTAIEGQLGSMVEEGQSDVYVYFAGHGVPDLKTKSPYLVPYDGNPAYPATSCYSVSAVYKALAGLKARSVTVVLDSCFSGGTGRAQTDGTLVANARPLFVESKAMAVPKGITVFAGADGEQVSSGYERMQHGLFTYFFLKGLQGAADLDRDRIVTSSEMQKYLKPKVAREARRLNRLQTPVLLGDETERVLIKY